MEFAPQPALEPDEQPPASQQGVKRNFYWIWFVGSAVWFFDAALSLHARSISWGVLETLVSAAFLAMGMYLKKQGRTDTRTNRSR